ncbi:GTPase family protein [Halomicroarcula sp. GCM10025710]
MAIDPEKITHYRKIVDDIIEWAPLKDENRQYVINQVFGEAFGEIEDLVEDSRSPRLYLFGRSGAGKSSLINALANKDDPVADVGTVEPTTIDSELYNISFPEQHATWEVVDSRGLFETVSPDGDVPADTVSLMKDDLQEYRPDILLHVVTPDQVRAGQEDFKAVQQLRDELGDAFPPVVYCLNKVDMHMSPGGLWPPDKNNALAHDIKDNLDFVARVLDIEHKSTLADKLPFHGYEFDSDTHIGVIPLCLREDTYWNVDTLSWLIGDFLPDDARLQFMQAQQRDQPMRRMSRDYTNRFSLIAGNIGGTPSPIADIAVLTPLQLLLVGVIGGFSCRKFEFATVQDYLTAMGSTTVTGLAARELARSLAQFLPVAGQIVSGGVAAGTTWAIGRSAEEYFFNDNVVKPSEFFTKGKKQFSGEFKSK